MFEMSKNWEVFEERHVHKLAEETRVCLKTWWKRMWRLHVAIARESVKRVLALGSVQQAMQNTSLFFFIQTYKMNLETILNEKVITHKSNKNIH